METYNVHDTTSFTVSGGHTYPSGEPTGVDKSSLVEAVSLDSLEEGDSLGVVTGFMGSRPVRKGGVDSSTDSESDDLSGFIRSPILFLQLPEASKMKTAMVDSARVSYMNSLAACEDTAESHLKYAQVLQSKANFLFGQLQQIDCLDKESSGSVRVKLMDLYRDLSSHWRQLKGDNSIEYARVLQQQASIEFERYNHSNDEEFRQRQELVVSEAYNKALEVWRSGNTDEHRSGLLDSLVEKAAMMAKRGFVCPEDYSRCLDEAIPIIQGDGRAALAAKMGWRIASLRIRIADHYMRRKDNEQAFSHYRKALKLVEWAQRSPKSLRGEDKDFIQRGLMNFCFLLDSPSPLSSANGTAIGDCIRVAAAYVCLFPKKRDDQRSLAGKLLAFSRTSNDPVVALEALNLATDIYSKMSISAVKQGELILCSALVKARVLGRAEESEAEYQQFMAHMEKEISPEMATPGVYRGAIALLEEGARRWLAIQGSQQRGRDCALMAINLSKVCAARFHTAPLYKQQLIQTMEWYVSTGRADARVKKELARIKKLYAKAPEGKISARQRTDYSSKRLRKRAGGW